MSASTAGCVSRATTLRSRIGRPPTASNTFGCAPPNRRPRPPAAMIAVTCIAFSALNSRVASLIAQLRPQRLRALCYPLENRTSHRSPERSSAASRSTARGPGRLAAEQTLGWRACEETYVSRPAPRWVPRSSASDAGRLPRVDRGGNDGAHAIGQRLRVTGSRRLERRRLDRVVHDQHHVGRLGPQPSLRHHVPRADHRERNDGQPGLDGEQETAALETADAAIRAARALRVDHERQPFRHERPPAPENARAIGMTAIDEQVAATAEMPPEHRESRQRRLRDDPQLIRQRGEEDRRIVDALVIGDEHVRGARRNPFETLNANVDPGGLQNQPRPGARAAMREVAAVDEARRDRRGTEHDRVDGDGWNEIEDRPPPVEGGERQVGIMNLEFGIWNYLEFGIRDAFQIPNS